MNYASPYITRSIIGFVRYSVCVCVRACVRVCVRACVHACVFMSVHARVSDSIGPMANNPCMCESYEVGVATSALSDKSHRVLQSCVCGVQMML